MIATAPKDKMIVKAADEPIKTIENTTVNMNEARIALSGVQVFGLT